MVRQVCGFVLVFGLAAASLADPPKEKDAPKPDKPGAKDKDAKAKKLAVGVTLYDAAEFKGREMLVTLNTPKLISFNYNDKAVSARWKLPKDKVAVLCHDLAYDGPFVILTGEGEIKNLADEKYQAAKSLSSVVFLPKPAKGDRPPGVPELVPVAGGPPEKDKKPADKDKKPADKP